MIKQGTSGWAKLALALLVLCSYRMGIATEPLSTSSAPIGSTEQQPAMDDIDPRDVFRPKIRIRDRFTAEISFAIRPGFYLYRDRLRVELIDHTTPAIPPAATDKKSALAVSKASAAKVNTLLALSIPNGKAVDDPTFGRVEVFESNVTILADLSRFQISLPTDKPAPAKIKVALVSQGCAIAEICYPPLSHEFLLPLQLSTAADNWINPQNETTLRFGQAQRPTQSSPSNPSGKSLAPSFDPAKSLPAK